MKETKQSKEYKAPQFQFVKTDEQNKVFFAGSGAAASSASGSISSMSTTSGSW